VSSRPPRFTRQVQAGTSRAINPSAGADSSALAQELEAFGERRQRDLERLGTEQGYQAGLAAGAAGEEISGNEFTARGRAFNQGAQVAHQAAVQTDIRDSIERYELEHQDDPEAFQAKYDGMLEGLLDEADPRLQPFIQSRAADYAGRAQTRIIGRQQVKLRAEATADLERGAEGMFEDATTAAFEGDVPMLEARRQEITALLEQGVAGELITEGAAGELIERFERDVTSQEVIGNFDRLVREQGPLAGTKAIQAWQKQKPSELGLTVDDHEAVTRQLVALKNREEALLADTQAKQSAAVRAERSQRQGRVTDSIKVLRAGFSPDKDQAKQVAEDIAWLKTSGDEVDLQRAAELALEFDVANAIAGEVHRFRRMPSAVRDAQLNGLEAELRKGGASTHEVELLKALRDTHADVDRQLEADPRGYLQREGLLEDAGLDFSGAEQLAESIAARDTDVGRQLTGQAVPRLTAAEADQLAETYNGAELEERAALLGVITAGGGDDALATLEQLDSKGHKRMALLGGYVLQGQGQLARDIMRGEALLTADTGIKPKRTDYQSDLDEVWQGAMRDWPEQRALYQDAAFAKYAELKARNGDLSDIFEPKLFRDALNAVLPTARFNGSRVAVPPGVTPRAFDHWTDNWQASDFAGIPGTEPEEMLELVRDRGRLVELGHGRYGIALGSAATDREKVLVREDGQPFVLDLLKAAPEAP
jgi:hypothetical protein